MDNVEIQLNVDKLSKAINGQYVSLHIYSYLEYNQNVSPSGIWDHIVFLTIYYMLSQTRMVQGNPVYPPKI